MQNPQQPFGQQPGQQPAQPGYGSPIPNPTGEMSGYGTPGAMGAMEQNTSGQGANAVLPTELAGFNWGAFFLNWIWGIAHSTWIALVALVLGFVPGIGSIASLAFCIFLGVKGNEMAWKNRRFESVEQFRLVQKAWMRWGLILFVLSLVLLALLFPVFMRAMQQAQLQRGMTPPVTR